MANISQYIAAINSAARGEEVRDSITGALSAINSDIPVQVAAALEAAKESGDFDGTGISSITLNSDYTLTINLDDGTSYTTTSIRGETGATGAQGPQGVSPTVTITSITGGHRVTITDEDHPSGQSFDVLDGTIAPENLDEYPIADSTNAVQSGGLYTEFMYKRDIGGVPDWNEDETSMQGYIKNRTHYEAKQWGSTVMTRTIPVPSTSASYITYNSVKYYLVSQTALGMELDTGTYKVAFDYMAAWEGESVKRESSWGGSYTTTYWLYATTIGIVICTEKTTWQGETTVQYAQRVYARELTSAGTIRVKPLTSSSVVKLPVKYLDMDSTPTSGSVKPVTSGGIYTALDGIDTALTGLTADVGDLTELTTTVKSDLVSAINEADGDISDLNTALSEKADIIISSASGDIASFADGADNLPVEDLTVGIEPVQDLHGYDNPWAPGGGKNLLPMVLTDIKSANTDGTWTGNAYTLNGITFTVLTDSDDNVTGIKLNGTAGSGGVTFHLLSNSNVTLNGTYKFWGDSAYEDRVMTISYLFSATQEIDVYDQTITQAVNDTLTEAHLYLWAGVSKSNVVVHPMFTLSTVSDDTFTPYSNICPITGFTGMTVNRVGKNLLNINSSWSVGQVINDTHAQTVVSNGLTYAWNSDRIRSIFQTITISGKTNGSLGRIFVRFRKTDDSGWFTSGDYTASGFTYNSAYRGWYITFNTLTPTVTIDIPQCLYMNLGIGCGSETNVGLGNDYIWSELQVELGSIATAYEPYSDTSIPISWQTEAGMVYGGSLNVTTGVLTVDRAMVDLGTLTWAKSTAFQNTLFYATDVPNCNGDGTNTTLTTNAICSQWGAVTRSDGYNVAHTIGFSCERQSDNSNGTLYIFDDNFASYSAEQFKAAISGAKIVYKVKTPQTYQLTPQEVKTLLGQNNIWADTGDCSVTYRADTKLYVDGKVDDVRQDLSLIAPIENGSTASQAYSAGQYFLKDDQFCKALTSIASGATFTLNTNYAVTTIAAELFSALSS